MDHESLRTASTYLNNLLLARGLLRSDEPVDFVKPSKESRAQIINLVHDLILRQDRDRTALESSADTLRGLRADHHRHTHEFERLKEKAEESARAATAAQHRERAAQTEVKKVEKAMKALQEQGGKLKAALGQVRAQCATDVRKRELELARLKTHLQGQQRGKSVGMAAPSLAGKLLVGSGSGGGERRKNHSGGAMTTMASREPAVADPQYSLRQETTEFLTQLSQSLSDENDDLIGLIRKALTTMSELLGLPADGGKHADSAIGSMGSDDGAVVNGKDKGNDLLRALPTSYETLSADMESALSHLQDLLTTPNYVSVEEVEVREEEIARLRAGWDRMEQRWREVLQMMEGWRQRMDTGDTINMEEIRRGIGLVSPASRERTGELPESAEASFFSSDVSEIRIDGVAEASILSLSNKPTKGTPKRKLDMLEPPDFFDLRPSSKSSKARSTSSKEALSPARPLLDILNDDEESEDLEVPQLTVEEKLSAAQAEAEEAAAASKVSNHREPSGGRVEHEEDTLGKIPSPVTKRTRIQGRPRKRKSTLSPDELEALIATDAGV